MDARIRLSLFNRHSTTHFLLCFEMCLLLGAFSSCMAQEVSPRREALLRMRGLVGVMHVYGDAQTFPPATWDDSDGNETCSWRLLLLDAAVEPSAPNIDEKWTSAENQRFDAESLSPRRMYAVKSFNSPSKYTGVFALVGPGTAFTEFERHKGKNLIDCPDDAILMIDSQNDSIHWMQPGDIELDDLVKPERKTGIGNLTPNYPEGHLVAFVDGSVWCISKDVPQDVISKFFTVESARKYDRETELGPYVIEKIPPLSKDDQGQYTFETIDLTK